MSLINVTLAYNSSAGGEAAVGSVLFIGTSGSPTTYTPLGNIGNEDWGLKLEEVDVTNQGTRWKRMLGTLFDGGKFSVEIFFIPSSVGADPSGAFGHGFASGLGAIFTLGNPVPWKLIFPDGTIEYFVGTITDFPISMDLTKALSIKMNITVTGQPIFA